MKDDLVTKDYADSNIVNGMSECSSSGEFSYGTINDKEDAKWVMNISEIGCWPVELKTGICGCLHNNFTLHSGKATTQEDKCTCTVLLNGCGCGFIQRQKVKQ